MINNIKNNVFQLTFEKFGSCTYLIILKNLKIIIDTSSKINEKEMTNDLKSLGVRPYEINIILLTHNHWDHTGNLELFLNAEIYDAKNIDSFHVKDIKAIKTPGHTTDGLCFLYQDILFSGDTIFHNGGRGRTDLPGGNEKQILESIKKLKELDYKILCPGHLD